MESNINNLSLNDEDSESEDINEEDSESENIHEEDSDEEEYIQQKFIRTLDEYTKDEKKYMKRLEENLTWNLKKLFPYKKSYTNFFCMFRLKKFLDPVLFFNTPVWFLTPPNSIFLFCKNFFRIDYFKDQQLVRRHILNNEDFIHYKLNGLYEKFFEEHIGFFFAKKNCIVHIEKIWKKFSIKQKKEYFPFLVRNENAINLIEDFLPSYISPKEKNIKNIFSGIASNKSAIGLIENNMYLFIEYSKNSSEFWDSLSSNPNAIHILKNNIDKVSWEKISLNPNGAELWELNPEGLNWRLLSSMPEAVPFLEKHQDKIDFNQLSKNKSAIPLIEKHIDKVNWQYLAENENAIHIIEKNIHRFKSYEMKSSLCSNPNAIHLIEKYPKLLVYFGILKNPNAIEIDYDFLTKRMDLIRKELISKTNEKIISMRI